jgi:hypothetical protein
MVLVGVKGQTALYPRLHFLEPVGRGRAVINAARTIRMDMTTAMLMAFSFMFHSLRRPLKAESICLCACGVKMLIVHILYVPPRNLFLISQT